MKDEKYIPDFSGMTVERGLNPDALQVAMVYRFPSSAPSNARLMGDFGDRLLSASEFRLAPIDLSNTGDSEGT